MADGSSDQRFPRWVKVLAIALAVVGLLVVAMLLVGGLTGGHNPMRHTGAGSWSLALEGQRPWTT